LKDHASDLLLIKRKQHLREVEQMKKILLIAVVAVGFAFAATPRTEARTFVSVGIGLPIGFGYYGGCGYPGYYGYGYGYPGYYPYGYYRTYRPYYSVGYRYHQRPYYWHHGRRVYYGRRVVTR
jgi:hypothetical protein